MQLNTMYPVRHPALTVVVTARAWATPSQPAFAILLPQMDGVSHF
jgi:hypothetical protein